jgi:hypothetical protein
MRKFLKSALVAVAAISALAGISASANAAPAGRHQTHYGNSVVQARYAQHRNFRVHRFEHRRHFRQGFRHGPVLYFGTGHNNGCYWLKRRAINTGSRYWWHRYNECRNG